MIMDDNIEKLVVEVPDDAIVAKQKAAGIQDCYFGAVCQGTLRLSLFAN